MNYSFKYGDKVTKKGAEDIWDIIGLVQHKGSKTLWYLCRNKRLGYHDGRGGFDNYRYEIIYGHKSASSDCEFLKPTQLIPSRSYNNNNNIFKT